MKRRDLLAGGVAGAALMALGNKAGAARELPPCMPMVRDYMNSADYTGHYIEREITEPVDLCDANGNLNPAAMGWCRKPLIRANLKGHWGRKKKWNGWMWICPEFHLSMIQADIDYASFLTVSFTDLVTHEATSGINIKRGGSLLMPDRVEETITFSGTSMEFVCENNGGDIKVDFNGKAMGGIPIKAEFLMSRPEHHESMTFVVPWSIERFQMNSKHNSIPTEGVVVVGDKTYEADPDKCHAILDLGRGMWPYRSWWNWGVGSGVVDGKLVAVNVGDKWTTATGANENGIFIDHKTYKVMEDLEWTYDITDWMKPWRVKSLHSDSIDITLTPILFEKLAINGGLLRTGGANAYGRWSGTLKAGGQTIEFRDMMGWAEEFEHRW